MFTVVTKASYARACVRVVVRVVRVVRVVASLERPVPDVSLERDHVPEHVAYSTRAAAGGRRLLRLRLGGQRQGIRGRVVHLPRQPRLRNVRLLPR